MPTRKTVNDAHIDADNHLSSMEGAEQIDWEKTIRDFAIRQGLNIAGTAGFILLTLYFKKRPGSLKELSKHFDSHLAELADGHILANPFAQGAAFTEAGTAFWNWLNGVDAQVKEKKAKLEQQRRDQQRRGY